MFGWFKELTEDFGAISPNTMRKTLQQCTEAEQCNVLKYFGWKLVDATAYPLHNDADQSALWRLNRGEKIGSVMGK